MFHASFALKFIFLFLRVFVLPLCVCICSHYTVTKNLCSLNTGQMIEYLFFTLSSYMISVHYFKNKRTNERQ